MTAGNALIPFLQKIHLFRGLDEEQLSFIAAHLREHDPYEAGETIVRQGEYGQDLFLVYEGQVELIHRRRGEERVLATLSSGDYFGEEAVLNQHPYGVTVRACTACRLFRFARNDFLALRKRVPHLQAHLEIAVASRKLARQVQFPWLQAGESIYFLARKHPIQLWKAILRPIFYVAVWLLLIALVYLFAPFGWLLIVGGLGVGAGLFWIWWNSLDWSNDYYLVTSRRVVWVEKVLGIYDSRQEAPLTTVLSVGVETSQWGRTLDFGDVIVRTFVGRIVFNEVRHPYEAAALIEEYWTRSREAARQADLETMQSAIRAKINPAPAVPAPQPPETSNVASAPSPLRPPRFLTNFLKMRFEEKDGVVTYRKHYIVLLLQTWKAALLFLISTLGALYFWLSPVGDGALGGLRYLSGILALVGVFWWGYEYVDWSNDRFQVTPDQIFDIDRKPFGREERKVAALDNILSTEYRRTNLLQVLFNYGHVYITVGGTQMVFENVANPSAVQQDIDQRRLARLERKRQAEAEAERERMASWIAAYHRLRQQAPEPPSSGSETGREG